MNGVQKRLLTGGILALALHIALFFQQLAEPQASIPKLLSSQRVTVSLGVLEVVKSQPPEPKQPRKVVEKTILQPTKAEVKVAQRPSVLKPAQPPENKPRPVAQKKRSPKPQTKRSIPALAEQQIVPAPVPVKETSAEKQVVPPLSEAWQESSGAQASSTTARIIQQAIPLYQINPPPRYPRQARRRGLEGVVLLEALIDISGRVAELRLFSSSGHPVLDRATLKSVQSWRFTPGTIGGNRQEMWVTVPVRFQLN